jgi:assimilatory nitrate reductase catalytic subunit
MWNEAWGHTPLWHTGHFPLKVGDQISSLPSPTAGDALDEPAVKLLISALERETTGRPEGGAKQRSTSQ